MCLSAILGVGSALIGASSASSAADAQEEAGRQQIELQREIYDDQTQRFRPYLGGGTDAFNALNFELGIGARPSFGGEAPQVIEYTDRVLNPTGGEWDFDNGRADPVRAPRYNEATRYRVNDQTFGERGLADDYAQANRTGGTEYQGYQTTPGYDYRLQQGIDAIDASAASRGGLRSGATLKAQQEHGQNFASNEYGNYLNRLASMASSGQAAAGMQAAAGQNFAAGASNALGGIGNAQAAGAIGVGNAFQSGISNFVGMNQYQNQLAGQNKNQWFGGGFGPI